MLLDIPLPMLVLNHITFPLQLLASRVASGMLRLAGVPVLREGNVINLPAMQLEADVADRRHDLPLLSQLAAKALQLTPKFEPAFVWRATAEANDKEIPQAEKDLADAEAMNPRDPRPHIEIAQMRLIANKFGDCDAELEKALVLDPNSETALHLLIVSSVMQKHPEKAVARAKQQIAVSPNNVAFDRELAMLQLYTKDYNGAEASAQKALALAPQDEGAAQTLSRVYAANGQADAAISLWRQWRDKHPNDAVATSLLGELYENKGDLDGAENSYQQSLKIDPHQGWAANNLAYLMVERNENLDTALSLAQQARAGRAKDPNTADTLAWVYYHKGMYGAARSLLEESLKDSPDNAAIQYHLGVTLSKMGDRPNAAIHLKKAIDLGKGSRIGQQAAQALASL